MGGVSMEWKEVRLGDLCSKIGSGATPLGGKEAYKGGDYHLIRSQNVLDFAFSKDGLASINDEQANKLKNVEIIQGDILLNITGDSVARCCIVPSEILPARVNQHVAIIRPRKEELDNNYLLYYLQYNKRQLLQIASAGATRNAITKAMIENFILPCPKSLEDQRRIASILSSLDRKIELNNKINADLEEMAQAIFKNWFVDFEPFKDGKFVDSELGLIPEGWKVGTLKDLLYLRKDSIKAANMGNLPYLPIDTIPMHCLVATDFKSNDEAKSSLQTFEQNDIVVGAMRVYFHRVILAPCKGITRTTCFVLSVKNENALAYSLMQCNQDEAISFAEKTSKGSTMPYAVWDGGYGEYKVVIPPSEVMKSFNDLLSNFFSKMNKNAIENSRLSLLRDTLLPRLMSGELEVPE